MNIFDFTTGENSRVVKKRKSGGDNVLYDSAVFCELSH